MMHSQQLKVLTALCLPLLMAPAWAADNFRLDSVDFISTDGRTHIIMHTGSILPYKKVLVSDAKLVLDIERVDADESVRTNFSGAANVSHVILKPLDAHRVRMIIRGQDLGAPVVAFNSPVAHDVGIAPALPEETSQGLSELQESGMQDAALTADDMTPQAVANENALLMAEEEPLLSEDASLPVAAPAPQRAPKAAPQPIVDLGANTPELGGGNSISRFFDAAAGGKFNHWASFGLLVLLLAGAGAFIRRKLISLNADEPSLEDLMTEHAGGRKVSFRELANAYRQQDDVRKTLAGKPPRPPLTAGKQGAVSAPSGRKTGGEELIGLRSLSKASAPQASARQAAYLESLLAAASAPPKPLQTPAPQKQVVNQYMKNQVRPPKAKAPKTRQAADERMAREMQRIQEVQQAVQQTVAKRVHKPGISSPHNPINRAPAANKSPLASHPRQAANKAAQELPAGQNQEVLSFLRNVAELMEKDGRTEAARNIQRNLNSI